MSLTRRELAAAALAAAALPSASRANPLASLTPLEIFTRIRCSPPGRTTWWSYSGHMLARRDGDPLRPMVSVIGASRSTITMLPDGNIRYALTEAGYYGDPRTGEIADGPMANVLTGEPMSPEHYLSPQTILFTPDLKVLPDMAALPKGLDYTGRITPPDIKHSRIWMAEELFIKLPGTPARVANSLANFEASVADVARGGDFVPATMQYTTLNSFRPWMNMGTAGGSIMMRLNALKCPGWDSVPEPLRRRILADHPEFPANA
ncbi:hypothetical protein [Polymorphobacter sp.]|uniref:hypothetical protein n=1 Tax=Polymorphobacter sp. TaxID=1909290 RepID=UPI003F703622